MKGYQIALWYCKNCAWSWKTLSTDYETEDQCPSCSSHHSQRVIRLKDLKSLGLKP